LGIRRTCVLALMLLVGCTPPVLQQAESTLLHTGVLAFLEDGRTTREEVLLRLGTPNARFEGERMITYAYWKTSDGKWFRRARSQVHESGGVPFAYPGPTHNLVLVFTPEGVLSRHSLVVSQ